MINERNFIHKLKKKNEKALEYTMDKYIGLVKVVVYRVLGVFNDNGYIEECISDVFIQVWNNSNKFNGQEEDFKKWVGAIAKFKAIDYYRVKVKQKEIEISETIHYEKNIEDEIIASENRDELIELINTLSEEDRKIFIMRYFLGLKNEEIANKLKLTKASVENRIYRGKKKLKLKVNNMKEIL